MENDVTNVESPAMGRGRSFRLILVLGTALAVALIVAGFLIGTQFGGSSSNAAGPAATASAAAPDGKAAKSIAYVACMRQNGVAKMPDPGVDGSIRITPDSGIDFSSASFRNAQKACGSLAPAPQSSQQQQQPGGSPPPPIDMTAYVKCMRANGLPDLPDPVDGMFNYDGTSAKFKAAHKICSKNLPSNAPQPPN